MNKRFLCALPLAFWTLLQLSTCPLYAQASCPLRLSTSIRTPSPAALWADDDIYWVSYVILPDSHYEIVAVGDTLTLSPSTFAMLARTDDRPISNWDKITFDARKIHIAMPLIFNSTQVVFRAEQVIWDSEGRVALKSAPVADHPDGVTIIAQQLDFSHAPPVPFDFDTDNWAAYPTNDKDVAPGERWSRSISISAGQVIPPRSATQSQDAWTWVRDLTRDRWDVLRGGQQASFSRRPYHLTFGQAGAKVFSQSLSSAMVWPEAYASKVQRTFVQNPYDPTTQQFFLNDLQLHRYLSLIRGMPRHKAATQMLVDVSDAVHRKVDLFGHPAEFVPRVKFKVLRAAFEQQFATTERLALRSIEGALGDSAAAASEVGRQQQLRQLEVRRDSIRADIADLQDRGAALTSAIETLRQELEAQTAGHGNIGERNVNCLAS